MDAAKVYLDRLAAENDFTIDYFTGTERINAEGPIRRGGKNTRDWVDERPSKSVPTSRIQVGAQVGISVGRGGVLQNELRNSLNRLYFVGGTCLSGTSSGA